MPKTLLNANTLKTTEKTQMKPLKLIFVSLTLVVCLSSISAAQEKHFHPKGKMPSKFTVELQNGLRKSLPFDDKRDFEENERGFIAAPKYKQIMA
jgi:alkyl sulfatase BDS1-like metallo-beta-lactamase superfamily hydrolase